MCSLHAGGGSRADLPSATRPMSSMEASFSHVKGAPTLVTTGVAMPSSLQGLFARQNGAMHETAAVGGILEHPVHGAGVVPDERSPGCH